MIIANLKDIHHYKGIHKNLDIALDYMQHVDIKNLENGKKLIAETDVYSIVSTYDTREHDASKYEVHEKYIDIQYMIEGEEIIYCSDKRSLQSINDYDEATDKQNLEGIENELKICLAGNMLAIFYPNDAHKACCKIDTIKSVKKLLIKVKL